MPSTPSAKTTALARSVQRLARHYGPVPSLAPIDPFQLLIWEYVAYLTDDEDRAAAFGVLEQRVGLDPGSLATASPAMLEAVCRGGGAIAFKLRAERIHDVAVRVRDKFEGTLSNVK